MAALSKQWVISFGRYFGRYRRSAVDGRDTAWASLLLAGLKRFIGSLEELAELWRC